MLVINVSKYLFSTKYILSDTLQRLLLVYTVNQTNLEKLKIGSLVNQVLGLRNFLLGFLTFQGASLPSKSLWLPCCASVEEAS
jgi:hypothetical protein